MKRRWALMPGSLGNHTGPGRASLTAGTDSLTNPSATRVFVTCHEDFFEPPRGNKPSADRPLPPPLRVLFLRPTAHSKQPEGHRCPEGGNCA